MARALVRSSSVVVVTLPSVASANTQIFERAMFQCLLEDLEVVEIGDDLLEGGAVVLDDLTGLTSGCLFDGDDLLTGTGPTHGRGVEAQVGDLERVDRLRLGGHDPLEGGVAGLDHAGG